jgi:hypothetical protein
MNHGFHGGKGKRTGLGCDDFLLSLKGFCCKLNSIFLVVPYFWSVNMTANGELKDLFSQDDLEMLFPAGRADVFFESMFGDSEEGAFDIGLAFKAHRGNELHFEFQLRQRPGKCLACNLTYGLPQVFKRHPVINVGRLAEEIENRLAGKFRCDRWELGATRELSRELHVIPLVLSLENKAA